MLVPINKIHSTVRDKLFAYMMNNRGEQRLRMSTVVIDLRDRNR